MLLVLGQPVKDFLFYLYLCYSHAYISRPSLNSCAPTTPEYIPNMCRFPVNALQNSVVEPPPASQNTHAPSVAVFVWDVRASNRSGKSEGRRKIEELRELGSVQY